MNVKRYWFWLPVDLIFLAGALYINSIIPEILWGFDLCYTIHQLHIYYKFKKRLRKIVKDFVEKYIEQIKEHEQ